MARHAGHIPHGVVDEMKGSVRLSGACPLMARHAGHIPHRVVDEMKGSV